MAFIKAENEGLFCGGKPILLRGFGLGGWFLPEGYMWKLYTKCDRPRRMEKMLIELCGSEYAAYFWKEYYDRYITEKDIELIAKEGFNSVRLPLNARHLYEIKDRKMEFIPETIARVDRLIRWCKKYQIYVVLDMHGAPGGQTGQNIDDSEKDEPGLFLEEQYKEELITLWQMLASRYAKEEIIAGYDLLNEPLPEWNKQYYNQLIPLYRRLMKEIRKVDQNHMIILEGVHWSTDFTIFDELTEEEAAENIMLQFHKYWSNPDKESLKEFIDTAKRLKVPLYMGEGGENNCDWYTTAFPLFERLGISWSFWSYKKMDCTNSPITFSEPEGLTEIINWIDTKQEIKREKAIWIFNNFLTAIAEYKVNDKVFHALKRQVPVIIPCEAYDDYQIYSRRMPGADLRKSEPVTILFENGKTGEVEYKRYGGEEQPKEENLVLQLYDRDSVGYVFCSDKEVVTAVVMVSGNGTIRMELNGQEQVIKKEIAGVNSFTGVFRCAASEKHIIQLICEKGPLVVDTIHLL